MVTSKLSTGTWVLLSYRIPREPSTPRIAAWRTLKRLGVAHIGDGLAALPADARAREQLEWLAEQIEDAGGTTTIWLAQMASAQQEQAIVTEMTEARNTEYAAVVAQAQSQLQEVTTAGSGRPTAVRRLKTLRGQMRQIQRRDYFAASLKETARAALHDLSGSLSETQTAETQTNSSPRSALTSGLSHI